MKLLKFLRNTWTTAGRNSSILCCSSGLRMYSVQSDHFLLWHPGDCPWVWCFAVRFRERYTAILQLETLDHRISLETCCLVFEVCKFGQFDGEWACMKQWLGCFAGLQGHLQRKGSDRSAFSVPWWCLNDQFWVNKKWECLENAWKRYAFFGTLQGRWPAFSDDFRVSDTLFAEARRGVGRGKSSPTPKRWNAFGVHRRRGVVHVIPIWHLSPSKAQDSSTKGVHFMLDEINKPQIRPLWQVLAVFNAPQKAINSNSLRFAVVTGGNNWSSGLTCLDFFAADGNAQLGRGECSYRCHWNFGRAGKRACQPGSPGWQGDNVLAMDWPFRGLVGSRFVRPCNALREFQRSLGLKVAIAVTPRSLVYLLVCF